MAWGTIELEPEVEAWLDSLTDTELGIAERHIDRLADQGVLLGKPYTPQLSGKLRELQIPLGRARVRVAYFIITGRRIILLTIFTKTQRQEKGEIERARRAMERVAARDGEEGISQR